MSYNIPILLNIFNRPDTTKKVFDVIRNIKPKKLYISADGPRENIQNDKELCDQARSIVNNIDWDCEVKYNFSEINLGCDPRMESAIYWFFNNEEIGIILEDDCLPSESFFSFCQEMLIKYKDDNRIGMVSGNNFQDGHKFGDGSYYFSNYSNTWGWATWKRVWDNYDSNLYNLESFIKENKISILKDKKQEMYWIKFFKGLKSGKFKNWDIKFIYNIIDLQVMCITPNINLVKNIGFGLNATNTKFINKKLIIKNREIEEIIHPSNIVVDYMADRVLFNKIFQTNIYKKIIYKLFKILDKFVKI